MPPPSVQSLPSSMAGSFVAPAPKRGSVGLAKQQAVATMNMQPGSFVAVPGLQGQSLQFRAGAGVPTPVVVSLPHSPQSEVLGFQPQRLLSFGSTPSAPQTPQGGGLKLATAVNLSASGRSLDSQQQRSQPPSMPASPEGLLRRQQGGLVPGSGLASVDWANLAEQRSALPVSSMAGSVGVGGERAGPSRVLESGRPITRNELEAAGLLVTMPASPGGGGSAAIDALEADLASVLTARGSSSVSESSPYPPVSTVQWPPQQSRQAMPVATVVSVGPQMGSFVAPASSMAPLAAMAATLREARAPMQAVAYGGIATD